MKDYTKILRENIGNYNFSDLFDIKELQFLQDQFSEVLHVAMVIFDKHGTEITNRSNFSSFCKHMRKQTRTTEACFQSAIGRDKPYASGYKIFRCEMAGLFYGIVNIEIGDIYVGDWYIGQIGEDGTVPDWDQLEEKGIQVEELKNDYKKLHMDNKASFESAVKLIYLFVKNLSQSTMQKYIQKAELERHSLMEKEMEHQNQQLIYENSYDMLTNARSRNYFYKILKDLNDKEDALPICVIVGDVNNLKFTNDLFGHRHGDWLLTTIAKIMLEEAESEVNEGGGYVVGRCGGDEFCVVMPNTKRGYAEWFCHRVNLRLAEDTGCCIPPAISFGVAKKSEMQQDIFRIMETADAKMYRNKMDFKSHYDLFSSIEEGLFRKGYTTREIVEKRVRLLTAFVEAYDLNVKKGYLDDVARYCDLGITIIPQRFYFKEELSAAEKREVHKAPGISAKLFLLNEKISGYGSSVGNMYENWDGSGYPRGLKEDRIDFLAQILRIVQDYVRFTSPEPVGKNKTFATARRMIKAESGILYNPDLVDKFLEFIVTIEK